jgi:hypothetical protein
MSINLQYPIPFWFWVYRINQLKLHITKLTSTDFDVIVTKYLYQTTLTHTLHDERMWIVSHTHECSNLYTWHELQNQKNIIFLCEILFIQFISHTFTTRKLIIIYSDLNTCTILGSRSEKCF